MVSVQKLVEICLNLQYFKRTIYCLLYNIREKYKEITGNTDFCISIIQYFLLTYYTES